MHHFTSDLRLAHGYKCTQCLMQFAKYNNCGVIDMVNHKVAIWG